MNPEKTFELFSRHIKQIKRHENNHAIGLCPFHNDRNPSFSVDLTTGKWKCHSTSCGKSGGLLAFSREVGERLPDEIYREFIDEIGLKPKSRIVHRGDKEESTWNEDGDILERVERYRKRLYEDDKLLEYWKRRGISPETLSSLFVGYDDKSKAYTIPHLAENREIVAIKRIYSSNPHNYSWEGSKRGYLYLGGIIKALDPGDSLIITEGEKDTLSLLDERILNVVGSPSSEGFKDDPSVFDGVRDIFILFDNDESGRDGALKVAKKIGYRSRVVNWRRYEELIGEELPRGFDLTDLRLKCQREGKSFRDELKKLMKLSERVVSLPIESLSPFIENLPEFLKRRFSGELIGYSTGLVGLDRITRGIHDLTVLGGEPKAGKSLLALLIAIENSLKGVPVVSFDFENSIESLLLRILSNRSELSEGKLAKALEDQNSPEFSPEEFGNYQKGMTDLRKITERFFVKKDRDLDKWKIIEVIQYIRESFGETPLVIIDSLQKLPWRPDKSLRRDNIDGWIRDIEEIRDKTKATILVVSELKRPQKGGNGYSRPSLDSFKESGDIEYSGDLLLGIWKDESIDDGVNIQVIESRHFIPGKEPLRLRRIPEYWGLYESI